MRSTDDVVEMVFFLEFLREQLHLAVQFAALYGFEHLDDQLLLGKRLLDVVVGSEPHCFDGAFDGAVRSHDDDFGDRLRCLD